MTRPSSGPWAHPPRRQSRSHHVIVWLVGMVAIYAIGALVWWLT
jgi:hypothetical protein